jgi:hypothetical protein
MQIVPLPDAQWDLLLSESPHATSFHTSFWKNAVIRAFGGEAILFRCEIEGRAWLVPVYKGAEWSSGFKTSSIGYGGPIPLFPISDPIAAIREIREIVAHVETECGTRCTGYVTFPLVNWERVDLAPGEFLSYTQILPLHCDVEHVFEKVVSGKVRTAIRRAIKGGLSVRKIEDQEIDEGHALLTATQKNVGASYTTPYPFFKHLAEQSGKGIETFGGFNEHGKMVAMSMMLHTKTSSFHLFNGWDRQSAPVGANQAVLWEMVLCSMGLGLKELNLGESHQESLKRAKEEWGSIFCPILKAKLI